MLDGYKFDTDAFVIIEFDDVIDVANKFVIVELTFTRLELVIDVKIELLLVRFCTFAKSQVIFCVVIVFATVKFAFIF
jgi:hypothetical protein